MAALRAAFDGIRAGAAARRLLVAGPPGVGKTALLDELRPMVTTSGAGWFVGGKVDQYRHDQATGAAVVQGLRALGRLLLAEPDRECEELRRRLLDGLGSNAGHLAATLPEFATLLRIPPEPATGDATLVTRRTYQAFVELLSVVGRPSRPVVLVVDDLQWASSFTLGALDAVLTDESLIGVLVVGGYRDGEVDATHPLAAMCTRWRRLEALAGTVTLQNLPEADLGAFVAEMLRMPERDAARLAAAIAVHTGGNPFDTVQLVNALRHEGALRLTDEGWQWDAGDVRRFIGTGDVLDLIRVRIERLPGVTRELLRTMACLGGAVELTLLAELNPAWLSEQSRLPALADGLLVLEGAHRSSLRFRHDRVQQAVHAATTLEQLRARQLQLSRALADRQEWDGVAAEQYLAAAQDVSEPAERIRAAALFEVAAEHARLVANHEVSERYLAGAVAMLTGLDDPRGEHGAALRRLIRLRHVALCALGRLDEADAVYAWDDQHEDDLVGLGRSCAAQIGGLIFRGRLGEAVELGRTALGRLGNPAPTHGSGPSP